MDIPTTSFQSQCEEDSPPLNESHLRISLDEQQLVHEMQLTRKEVQMNRNVLGKQCMTLTTLSRLIIFDHVLTFC